MTIFEIYCQQCRVIINFIQKCLLILRLYESEIDLGVFRELDELVSSETGGQGQIE